MALDTGYGTGIRQSLVDKGIDNGAIGYNDRTGYVTVNGQDAVKAAKQYNGTSFTTKQGFNTDWDKYQKSIQQPSYTTPSPVTTTPAPAPSTTSDDPYKTNNPYDTQYNDLLKTLMDQAKNPTPVDVNAIYNSPQYAAYQAQAQKGAQQGIRAAQEALGSSGFGRSTALGERAQGIQNDATNYLNTQVLPQLMAQEQASRQQQLQNQFAVLDQIMNQQGVYDNRFNNANQYALNKGELTGTFRDPQADAIINNILQLKQGYGGLQTADDRLAATNEATRLRSQLSAMGIDPAAFGANKTLAQAQSGMSGAGVKTLAAKDQEFNQGVTMAGLTGKLPDGTPTTAEQQRQLQNEWAIADQTGAITPTLAKLYGLKAGTPTRAAKEFAQQLAISQQNANTSAYSAATSRDSLDWSKDPNNPDNQGKATDTSKYFDQLSSMYVAKDPYTGAPTVTNPAALRSAIIGLSLDDANTDKLLLQFGLQPN